MKPLPTSERLHELFEISPAGMPIRRTNASANGRAGAVAGSLNRKGYRVVSVDRSSYLWHRLVLQMSGRSPGPLVVDHINGDITDNRPENLRAVAPASNSQNIAGPHKANKSGFLGVHRHDDTRWRAQIMTGSRRRSLGLFDTAEEAHQAYLQAKAELHSGAVMSRFGVAA
ncbi:MAG: hypothetical protein RL499_1633 [Actinomycetota bacterium]|jgi:hypothetical protein